VISGGGRGLYDPDGLLVALATCVTDVEVDSTRNHAT
jgi:hypothetical protein